MHSAIIESIGNKVILAKTSGVQKGIYSKRKHGNIVNLNLPRYSLDSENALGHILWN